MCGRFVSSNSPDRIASYFGASFESEPLGENFNVAPTQDVLGVVADDAGSRAVRAFHWGLVPSWATDAKIGSKMINARAETLAEKNSFKKLLISRRIIIPMDGFYEWKLIESPDGAKPTKQPMFIHRRDGEPLAVAGLWTTWRDRSQDETATDETATDETATDETATDETATEADRHRARWLHSCTVITTSANETMAPVHNRMPVLLPATRWEEWLDPANADVAPLLELLVPAPNDLLTMHPVATLVNNVRNNGPELIDQLGSAELS